MLSEQSVRKLLPFYIPRNYILLKFNMFCDSIWTKQNSFAQGQQDKEEDKQKGKSLYAMCKCNSNWW